MTIYTTPPSSKDQVPSVGERLGTAFGKGISAGLKELAEEKVEQLKTQKERQKTRGALPQKMHSHLSYTGRSDAYGREDRDELLRKSYKYFDQGYGDTESIGLALQEHEKEPETGLDILREGYKAPETKARFMDLFKMGESEALRKSIEEKTKTAKSLDDFTQGELISLKSEDLKNLPKKEQEKFWEIAPFLTKRMGAISQLSTIPFVGGALEERAREAIDPELPPPPGMATVARIAGELPFLGPLLEGATLGEEAIRGAAFFGGEAALSEAIRTLGTEKPADLKKVGIQTLIGGLFPYGMRLISKMARPFRNALAREMQATGTDAAKATDNIFKRAQEEGVSLGEMQAGNEETAKKFTEFLTEDAQTTLEKIKKMPLYRAEAAKEAEKRFAKEAKALAKTPIDKYFEPVKKPAAFKKRMIKIGPEIKENARRIQELGKEVKQKTGEELIKAQEELNSLIDKNYKLNYEVRYGKPPATAAELTAQADKSAENLVEMIITPTEDTLKAIQKNDKMMQTFLDRAKNELVKGKLPEQFMEDTFLGIQDAHLNAYKDLKKLIKREMLVPYSNIRGSGAGPQILEQLDKRIKGIEAATKVQQQKRKVLRALKGPTGVFYRNWIDKIKGEQKLFTSDMIKMGDKINKGAKNISATAKEKVEESGFAAFKKSAKEFEEAAQKAGFTKEEIAKLRKILEKVKKPPANLNTQQQVTKWLKPKIDSLLKPIKNQIMAGFVLGSIDSVVKETTGKKIPSAPKRSVYAIVGLPIKGMMKRPILGITAYFTDEFLKHSRKKYYKERVKGKRGIERLREIERIKEKKGFSSKELKEIKKG